MTQLEGESKTIQSINSAIAAKPRIVLIGVAHVFDIREKVRQIIIKENPQIVALELDPARFQGLMTKGDRPGDAPFLYQMLARFQSDLAEQFGSEVGSEMISAATASREIGAKIALIDMDASELFLKLRKSMSLKEKILMIIGVFMAFFTRKSTVEKEMKRYSENEEQFLGEIKKSYPTIMKVLIDDRNKYMIDRLREISTQSQVIVAVVGDGHVPGMQPILSEFSDVVVWRLDKLQSLDNKTDNREMTMSFTLQSPDSKV